jgi:hypothetical protein
MMRRGAAHPRAGLSAGGEQLPPTDGLQPGRPAQRAGDPDRFAGRRAATRHPRGVAGHPGSRDHPHISYRDTGLPAIERERVGRGESYSRLRPFFLPLFTQVRGIVFLRTSPFGHSRKFASRSSPMSQNTQFEGYTPLPHGRKVHPCHG